MLTLARAYSCYSYPPLLQNRLTAPPAPPPSSSSSSSSRSHYPTFQPRSSSLPRSNNGGGGALGDALVAACLDADVRRVRSLLALRAPVNWHCTAKDLAKHPALNASTAVLPISLPTYWTPLAAACAAQASTVALVRCLLAHNACVDERAVCVAVIAPTSALVLPLLLLVPKSPTSNPSSQPQPRYYPLALLLATTTSNTLALSILLTHSSASATTSASSLYPAATLATAAHAAAAGNHPRALRVILRAGSGGGGGGGGERGEPRKKASPLACPLNDPQREIVTAARNGFWGVVRVLLDEILDVGGASHGGDVDDDDDAKGRDGTERLGPPPSLSALRATPAMLPPTPGIELSWEDVMVDIG
ncbi:hypothetical protein HDU87_004360 [Geranomyces variabilis]|uniref:Ankyrin repeat protein n=1 Tax=Geranomyces variabilis TaxID=109894 RepID=A0AAD5TJQ9_9FUNG|nr:hypothetical protein HDU87_004360 [Geranomyces variabilis]